MKQDVRVLIAKRAAMELQKDWVVNLGTGIPALVADFIDESKNIYFQAENGFLGVGAASPPDKIDPYMVNAASICCEIVPGGSFFDSAASFMMIRGGRLNATILGSMQVSQTGDFANWTLPGKDMLGMGGALDLACGNIKPVIITMQHVSAKGEAKILAECTIPLTGRGVVDTLITEFAVFYFRNGRMFLEEINPEVSLEELKRMTPAEYEVSRELKSMEVK